MSGSINRWSAMGLALMLGATGPALAQDQALEAGAFVDGEVSSAGTPAVVTLRAAPGQTVQLDAIPGARAPDGVDLTMKVYDAANELVGEDDDGGGALNPRISVTSEAGGVYRVEVDVLGDEGAPFTLIARASVFVPEVVTELALADGRVERTVSFPDEDDALFTFAGKGGQAYLITLVAEPSDAEGEQADPMLELFQGSGSAGTSLFTDDDGGGNLNSRIVAELPEDGTYTVRVSTLSGGGRAQLAIAPMTIRPATVGDLAYATPATVTFGPDSPFVTEDSDFRLRPYAIFRLPASPAPRALAGRGEKIVLEATSEGLDPWLEVGFDTPFGFMSVLDNDDFESLNSRVVLDPSKLEGSDGADWWRRLRVRVTVPQNSEGDVAVSAVRSTE